MAFATLCLLDYFMDLIVEVKVQYFKLVYFLISMFGMPWNRFSVIKCSIIYSRTSDVIWSRKLISNSICAIYVLAFIPTLIIQIFKVINEIVESRNQKKSFKGNSNDGLKI